MKKNTAFATLLLLCIISSVIVSFVAGSKSVIELFGNLIPLYSFAGVFSAIANICVIFMTMYCGKKGYITALIMIILQLYTVIIGIFVKNNFSSLPGIFQNLLTTIAITVVYLNNKRISKYQSKIRKQVITDMLTGLPNMAAFSELINNLIINKEKFVVVMINLNNFKNFNDTMGFDAGNKVLQEVASRWEEIAKSNNTNDFLAHSGADEFALIIRDYKSDDDIMNSVARYDQALNSKLTVDDCDFYITASFGYSEFPKDGPTSDALCAYASTAMREVKNESNSDHIMRYAPELLKNERTLEIEKKIRDALENDRIFFNLQPQFDMSHKLRGFEVLARMKDSDGNMISPAEFIPVAEKVGLVDRVDAVVFRKSAMFFGDLLKKSGADITLSVNASVKHLMKNNFLDEVRETLKISGVPASNLEIEITESIMLDTLNKAFQSIKELKNMGIKIAIDDFGVGYSSLSYLNKLPANLLKIDKSFIDKMNSANKNSRYVAAIISIGHIMGFKVISEGVELPEQLETLRSIGCDFIQGFIWGRPLPETQAAKLLSSRS
ncbi:MAG: EAL domain-containing protein [Synergistaceae bacterium]|nr:EAL domain-containing protein [Synergistaceae bacterium]